MADTMTLDEAIEHAQTVADGGDQPLEEGDVVCADNHAQLATWLRELRTRRAAEQAVAPEVFHRPTQGINFGRHLIVEGWCWCAETNAPDPEAARLLNSPECLAEALNEIVQLVGMDILRPADMCQVPLSPSRVETDEDDGGVTGTVILTTSHGSIHTWPLQGQFAFDLFSCRDFDVDVVVAFLKERLGMTGGEIINFKREHSAFLKNELRKYNT